MQSFTKDLPIEAFLLEGPRGLYCCLDGGSGRVKYHFVDRANETELCAGPVIITEITDKGTYGFIKGKMKSYPVVPLDVVARFAVKKGLFSERIRFCRNKFGFFVAIDYTETQYVTVCYSFEHGELTEVLSSFMQNEYTTDHTYVAADLISFVYQGCLFEELNKKFVRFDFVSLTAPTSPKFFSKTIDDMQSAGLFTLRSVQNILFFEINERNFANILHKFSREEVDEASRIVTRVNKQANESVLSKLRSGKITLV